MPQDRRPTRLPASGPLGLACPVPTPFPLSYTDTSWGRALQEGGPPALHGQREQTKPYCLLLGHVRDPRNSAEGTGPAPSCRGLRAFPVLPGRAPSSGTCVRPGSSLPLQSSVRSRNSACPVSDSSFPTDAAEQNWTTLGWPESFFCGRLVKGERVSLHTETHVRGGQK